MGATWIGRSSFTERTYLVLYRSSATAGTFFDIHDAGVGLVKPTDVDEPVEEGPDVLGNQLEFDDGAFEQATEEDLVHLPHERREEVG